MSTESGTGAPTRPATDRPPRALFRGKAWFWVPIAPLVALDLWSKAAAFDYVAQHRGGRVETDLLPDPFGFALVAYRNTGSIWGIGQDQTIALMVLRCAALFVILWFVAGTWARQRLQQVVLGLIFAGAIGNLYDNFMMPDRGVRDFLLFYYRPEGGAPWQWPAFNVADSCISVGAVLLLILLWREPDAAEARARTADAGNP